MDTQVLINEALLMALRGAEKRIERLEYIIEDVYEKVYGEELEETSTESWRL